MFRLDTTYLNAFSTDLREQATANLQKEDTLYIIPNFKNSIQNVEACSKKRKHKIITNANNIPTPSVLCSKEAVEKPQLSWGVWG